MEELPSLGFPFVVIEDDGGFRFLSTEDARRTLERADAARVADEERCYFNLYLLTEEFAPDPPGVDEMGLLRHWHIENWHLDQHRRAGWAWFET